MKNIIIRADDLGYSKGVNYGTYESVKNGLINNVGVMVNMLLLGKYWLIWRKRSLSFLSLRRA